MDPWADRPHYNNRALELQGTIGVVCLCIVLMIFFPWLAVPIFILFVANMAGKASEWHDRWEARRRERPSGNQEPLSGPFEAEPPEDIF